MQQDAPTQQTIIIIGAGLSGLMTAFRLQKLGVNSLILEARDRLGGRILTHSFNDGSFDLGPAWFWEHHTNIQRVMRELGVKGFLQFEDGAAVYDNGTPQPQYFHPPPSPRSFRFAGGVGELIARLAAKIGADGIQLNTIVHSIQQKSNGLLVRTNRGDFSAESVVCTLPPKLVVDSLSFDPDLPTPLKQAMNATITWMGQAMKVTLAYERAFWREKGLSGLTISHVGPIAQFHDHVSADTKTPALFGWIGDNSPARQLSLSDRRQVVIDQAVRLFGAEASQPLDYAECNWAQEPFTTHPSRDIEPATEHPQYGHPLLQAPQLNGRLHWAVTEASPVHGGYLDGAIFIAERTATRLSQASR